MIFKKSITRNGIVIDAYLEENPLENFVVSIPNELISDIAIFLSSSLKAGKCLVVAKAMADIPENLDIKARKTVGQNYIFLNLAFKNSLINFRISKEDQLFDSLKNYLN